MQAGQPDAPAVSVGKPKPKGLPETLMDRLRQWIAPSNVLIMPAVLIILFLSVFPLLVSALVSFTSIRFVRGGFEVDFVGLNNYEKILFGSSQRQFLGRFDTPSLIGWALLGVFVAVMLWLFYTYYRSERRTIFGVVMRVITIVVASALGLLVATTLSSENGLPGTLVVTLIFVFVGVTAQYLLGLGLALLLVQDLPGKRFFRVLFLLPMMITPVGIGFLFRMLIDTSKGPFANIWYDLGLASFSFLGTPEGARLAIIIGDTWQWTPFMFIILLAALEGVGRDLIEAALVDGANRWQMFRSIILPQIIPVSTTVILIRLIESFKIIDMPNTLTYGGPGTATESVTLQAYIAWRTLDLGGSAALSYVLLFVVTFTGLVFVNIIRRRLLEAV